MTLKSLCTHFFLCLLLTLFSLPVMAKPSKGELTIDGWRNGEGTVSIPVMKLRYSLDTFFGEPIEQFIFYYESQDDFTEILNIKLTAQVVSGGNIQNAFININPTIEPPRKWGWDVAGSADWDKMFVTASGEAVSAEETKSFFKHGISLTNLKIDYINAQSGVDDEQYDAYASLLPTSYVRSKSGQRNLELNMPSFDYWNSSNSFWKDRVSAASNWVSNVNTANSSEVILPNTDAKITAWKYGQYQHVVIERGFSHRADKHQESQVVEIDIVWNAWDSATTKKRTFRQTVKKGQMVMVAGDRIRRPLKKDGSLATYNLSITVRFINEDKEEEDPLQDIAEVDVLAAALKKDQSARFERVIQQQEQDVDNTRADNKKAYEAAKLAAEKKEKKRIAREEYLASNQYKIDQALEKKKRDDLERDRQLALAEQQETERLQRLREEEEERIKYGQLYVVVTRSVEESYQPERTKRSKCPKGKRCLRFPKPSYRSFILTGVSKVITIRYLRNPGGSVAGDSLPANLLNNSQFDRLTTWRKNSQYQGILNFYYFLSKAEAEDYMQSKNISEFYMEYSPPDLSW